jgi:hypothetical protein
LVPEVLQLEQHTASAGCCLKITDASVDWLYTEDQFEKCFRSLHGSIHTIGGTSTASKPCVRGAAASCGNIATTYNSTNTGGAFQSPAGTTSGGECSMEQRLACDQSSTREQVDYWICFPNSCCW